MKTAVRLAPSKRFPFTSAWNDILPASAFPYLIIIVLRTLYAILLSPPENGRFSIESLARMKRVIEGGIRAVSLPGSDKQAAFVRDDEGLHVTLPGRTNEFALAVKIELDGSLVMEE